MLPFERVSSSSAIAPFRHRFLDPNRPLICSHENTKLRSYTSRRVSPERAFRVAMVTTRGIHTRLRTVRAVDLSKTMGLMPRIQ